MDETHEQRIEFLCRDSRPYKTGADAIVDLTGEQFQEGSDFYGRADLRTEFDQNGGFTAQPVFLIRDRDTGEIQLYTRDEAHPARNPSLYAVEISVVYPDGDLDTATVCYKRTKNEAKKYAAKLTATV